jgi:glycosyltransferase involved in cell wall biosynthesis
MPISSILIPVYNRQDLILRTLNSALAQTVSDIEIIVVDNNSTDSTYEIVAGLAATDSRIRLYRNDENIGPVRNWAKCAEYATAPYAKILFSDDLIAPTYLERTLPAIISRDCALVYTPAVIGYEDWKGTVHYRAFIGDCKIARDHFLRATTDMENFIPVSPGAALFRTSDLRKYILAELPGVKGYDFARYGAGVDWLIYALTALRYQHVAYVADPLVYFHAHAGSITIANENNQIPMGYALAKKWLRMSVKSLN